MALYERRRIGQRSQMNPFPNIGHLGEVLRPQLVEPVEHDLTNRLDPPHSAQSLSALALEGLAVRRGLAMQLQQTVSVSIFYYLLPRGNTSMSHASERLYNEAARVI